MAGHGIYWTDGTPYLVNYWCQPYYHRCKCCKQNKITVRHAYKILDLNSKLSFVANNENRDGWGFQGVRIKLCLSCFEKHKFIRPTEEELQHHIFKLRKKKQKNF